LLSFRCVPVGVTRETVCRGNSPQPSSTYCNFMSSSPTSEVGVAGLERSHRCAKDSMIQHTSAHFVCNAWKPFQDAEHEEAHHCEIHLSHNQIALCKSVTICGRCGIIWRSDTDITMTIKFCRSDINGQATQLVREVKSDDVFASRLSGRRAINFCRNKCTVQVLRSIVTLTGLAAQNNSAIDAVVCRGFPQCSGVALRTRLLCHYRTEPSVPSLQNPASLIEMMSLARWCQEQASRLPAGADR
jgi:hypothetical protein